MLLGDLGERWDRRGNMAYRALPYFLLVVSIALGATAAANGYGTWGEYRLALILAGAALVWQLLWDVFQEKLPRQKFFAAIFFTIRFAITAWLVALNPWFGVFAFQGYLDALRLFSRPWPVFGVVGSAFLLAASQSGGFPAFTPSAILVYLGVVALDVVLAGGFSFAGHLLDVQNQQRKEAITTLVETNRKLEVALAENAGLHAQLLVQAHEAGTLDERARMAREIHDTLAQGLAGIVTQIQAAEQAAADPERWRRHVEAARRLARESLAEARRSVQAMRPQALEDAHLVDALAKVTRDWSALHGVSAELAITGTARTLRPEIEFTMLRAAQEALTNVAKHANATRVGITLSYMEDLITLDVRDDGRGFDPAGSRAEHGEDGFGLTAMHQRVDRLGGKLVVESEPNNGAAISVTLPAFVAGDAR